MKIIVVLFFHGCFTHVIGIDMGIATMLIVIMCSLLRFGFAHFNICLLLYVISI